MSSIIEGYNNDIFISYRQKDNKYDGWVTEFVDNLKKELEATFKEEISVYFDINPHDGLLETHDVDESLKEKLKCLVFIPIISRTYCDPKSFAWEHEFKAFAEEVSKDQFGLKVRLPDGNIAGRVLPVRIHDLDNEDIKLCESVLGSALRGIEFIYKEPGVNRPLSPKDDERKNLNGTIYRNQINKVANAIDAVIIGLKNYQFTSDNESKQQEETSEYLTTEKKMCYKKKSGKSSRIKLISIAATASIFITVAIIAYPIIFKQGSIEEFRADGKISVAVMPFQNRTTDLLWKDSQAIIQSIIINRLSNSADLKVRESGSIELLIKSHTHSNSDKITPSIVRNISEELNASVFVTGSINQGRNKIRLQAELFDSKTGQIIKAFQIDGLLNENNCIDLADSLSVVLNSYLIVTILEKEVTPDFQNFSASKSPEAYRKYIMGVNSHYKLDYPRARKYLHEAIEIDSNFVAATIMLSWGYFNERYFDQAKEFCIKAYSKRNQMNGYDEAKAAFTYACNFETPREEIKAIKRLLEIDDQVPLSYYDLGYSYSGLHQYDKAIPEYENALRIYNKWDLKPIWIEYYTSLGKAYHETGQYKKEKKLYRKAEQNFPDNQTLIRRQAILVLSRGKINTAKEYIDKYKSILKTNSLSEADIITSLAEIYNEAGISDVAEQYYRKALSLAETESDNSRYLCNLAWFLINTSRDVDEGLELVNKALEINPDDYYYLHCKGWGLFKQGKSKDALEFLQKSWQLKPIYDHELFLHIEEVKKAIAG